MVGSIDGVGLSVENYGIIDRSYNMPPDSIIGTINGKGQECHSGTVVSKSRHNRSEFESATIGGGTPSSSN